MRVGVLEVLAPRRMPSRAQAIGYRLINRQFASIMPQAIASWCRQLGHQTFYAIYYGQGDPKKLIPDDLDAVFIATHTHVSALAYALAKIYKRDKTLTIIGGPHARSFPQDCIRFFDLVVLQCDKVLVADILRGAFDPNSIVSSDRALKDLPSVEERLPEIRASALVNGRRHVFSTVPVLASMGCPYTCDFCTDWNNPYVLMPPDQLEADLRYLSQHLPGIKVGFHDPNFAVRFDQTLGVLERLPPEARVPYIMASTLSVLRGPRLQRLRDTNCIYIGPGIESWSSYSNKAGVGRKTGSDKVQLLVAHFELIREYVPGIQVGFIFGLDCDEGDEPVELTKEFIARTPFAWHVVSIPVPFGGTPLHDNYLRQGRILTLMPFTFYTQSPYLVFTLKHYDPITYYQKLIDLFSFFTTGKMLWRRLRTTQSWTLKLLNEARALGMVGQRIRKLQEIQKMMITDSQFLAFHEGESSTLPEFYHREYEYMLGEYSPLLSRADRIPELEQWGIPTASGQVIEHKSQHSQDPLD